MSYNTKSILPSYTNTNIKLPLNPVGYGTFNNQGATTAGGLSAHIITLGTQNYEVLDANLTARLELVSAVGQTLPLSIWVNNTTATTTTINTLNTDLTIEPVIPGGQGRSIHFLPIDGIWTAQSTPPSSQTNGQIRTFIARVSSTTNGLLATAFANGQVLDGITLVTNDIILLTNQTTATENGIYAVNTTGIPTRLDNSQIIGNLCTVLLGTNIRQIFCLNQPNIWQIPLVTPTSTSSNGLTTISGDTKLGGTLSTPTTINLGGSTVTFNSATVNNSNVIAATGAQRITRAAIGNRSFEHAVFGDTESRVATFNDGIYIGDGVTVNGWDVKLQRTPTGMVYNALKHTFTGNLELSGEIKLSTLPGTAGQVLTSAGAGVAATWTTVVGTKKFGITQALAAGANTINHNLGLLTPFYSHVLATDASTGTSIMVTVTSETSNSLIVTVATAITSAKIVIIG